MRSLLVLFIIAILTLTGCQKEEQKQTGTPSAIEKSHLFSTQGTFSAAGKKYNIVVAQAAEDRERGLMKVTDFSTYDGMLFDMQAESQNAFWMGNTPTPLRIYWIYEHKIIGSTDMQPCESGDVEQCEVYAPPGPYTHALEMPLKDAPMFKVGTEANWSYSACPKSGCRFQ